MRRLWKSPKFGKIRLVSLPRYSASFDPNPMILARMVLELLHGKVQNLVKSNFRVKFDIEGQGQ